MAGSAEAVPGLVGWQHRLGTVTVQAVLSAAELLSLARGITQPDGQATSGAATPSGDISHVRKVQDDSATAWLPWQQALPYLEEEAEGCLLEEQALEPPAAAPEQHGGAPAEQEGEAVSAPPLATAPPAAAEAAAAAPQQLAQPAPLDRAVEDKGGVGASDKDNEYNAGAGYDDGEEEEGGPPADFVADKDTVKRLLQAGRTRGSEPLWRVLSDDGAPWQPLAIRDMLQRLEWGDLAPGSLVAAFDPEVPEEDQQDEGWYHPLWQLALAVQEGGTYQVVQGRHLGPTERHPGRRAAAMWEPIVLDQGVAAQAASGTATATAHPSQHSGSLGFGRRGYDGFREGRRQRLPGAPKGKDWTRYDGATRLGIRPLAHRPPPRADYLDDAGGAYRSGAASRGAGSGSGDGGGDPGAAAALVADGLIVTSGDLFRRTAEERRLMRQLLEAGGVGVVWAYISNETGQVISDAGMTPVRMMAWYETCYLRPNLHVCGKALTLDRMQRPSRSLFRPLGQLLAGVAAGGTYRVVGPAEVEDPRGYQPLAFPDNPPAAKAPDNDGADAEEHAAAGAAMAAEEEKEDKEEDEVGTMGATEEREPRGVQQQDSCRQPLSLSEPIVLHPQSAAEPLLEATAMPPMTTATTEALPAEALMTATAPTLAAPLPLPVEALPPMTTAAPPPPPPLPAPALPALDLSQPICSLDGAVVSACLRSAAGRGERWAYLDRQGEVQVDFEVDEMIEWCTDPEYSSFISCGLPVASFPPAAGPPPASAFRPLGPLLQAYTAAAPCAASATAAPAFADSATPAAAAADAADTAAVARSPSSTGSTQQETDVLEAYGAATLSRLFFCPRQQQAASAGGRPDRVPYWAYLDERDQSRMVGPISASGMMDACEARQLHGGSFVTGFYLPAPPPPILSGAPPPMQLPGLSYFSRLGDLLATVAAGHDYQPVDVAADVAGDKATDGMHPLPMAVAVDIAHTPPVDVGVDLVDVADVVQPPLAGGGVNLEDEQPRAAMAAAVAAALLGRTELAELEKAAELWQEPCDKVQTVLEPEMTANGKAALPTAASVPAWLPPIATSAAGLQALGLPAGAVPVPVLVPVPLAWGPGQQQQQQQQAGAAAGTMAAPPPPRCVCCQQEWPLGDAVQMLQQALAWMAAQHHQQEQQKLQQQPSCD